MERFKILFLTPWYPSRDQPVLGVFVREMAHAARLRNEVTVLHAVGPDRSLANRWQLDEETDPVLTQDIPTYRLHWQPWLVPPRNYCAYSSAVLAAVRLLGRRGFTPDVIHAHVYPSSVAALMVGKLYRKPVVLTEHSSDFPRRSLSSMYSRSVPFVLSRMDCIMPVSAALQSAIEAYGVTARFRVVPNMVDTRTFYPEQPAQTVDKSKRLLFVGLLEPTHNKGVPHLFQALAQISRTRTDWRLDLIGDGPTRAEYERLAADLAIADRVKFLGVRTKPEVAQAMRHCDFLVSASLHETFGIVVAEALACGKPVIVTDCGGPAEFVSEEVGLIVPPGDVVALAQAINQMLDRHHTYQADRLAQFAQERFSPEAIGEALDRVYREVLAHRG